MFRDGCADLLLASTIPSDHVSFQQYRLPAVVPCCYTCALNLAVLRLHLSTPAGSIHYSVAMEAVQGLEDVNTGCHN